MSYFANYLETYKNSKKFLLYGDIGAGKTTFVREFLPNYSVTSPTFSIYNQYAPKIFHFDLYNIDCSFFELNNLNFFEIMNDPESIVFVEWAEKISESCKKFLVSNYISLKFENYQITRIHGLS